MNELPKVRHHRAERDAPVNAYHMQEDSGGWAVSYADMLMVLLSFFVIFFSIDSNHRNSIIYSIYSTALTSQSASASKGTEAGQTGVPNSGPHFSLLDLSSSPFNPKIKKIQNDEMLVLLLPENSFRPGKLNLNQASKRLLIDALEKLSKYKDVIQLRFVGSSDVAAVKHAKTNQIKTNFDLSALRASRALQTAVSMGFPIDNLQVAGEGEYGRKSRTLSIEITPKRLL